MSMFYELMMRKKEEIMYATIKGTLTENNGVFSGFSASNYLEVNYTPQNINNYELGVKFTLGNSVSSTQTIIGQKSTNVHTPQLAIDSSRKLFFSFPNASHSWVSVNTTYALNIDTTYEAKMIWTGNKVYAYLKSNSVWELVGESDLVTNGWDEPILIGLDTGLNAWGGSIDLNNSYIKLGSTKYNLQAVVGYTVVGSPTITDGVVSGIYYSYNSADNRFVKISQQLSATSITNFEIVVRVNIPTTTFAWKNIFYSSSISAQPADTTNTMFLRVNPTNGVLQFSPNFTYDVNNIFSFTNNISLDTWKYVKISYSDGVYSFYYSSDGTIWTLDSSHTLSVQIVNSKYLFFGCSGISPNVTFDGSIDLNETYIKINNKLWFNGQQA